MMSSSYKNGQATKLKPRPLGLKEGLTEMYQEALLCDVTLVADGERFPCHRALLAAVSPHFRDIFVKDTKQPRGEEVQLQDVSPSIVQHILKYIYTEELVLTPELAPLLFMGASQLQIIPLQNICCRFLVAHLSVQNCFEMYSLARGHPSPPLLHAVLQLLIRNFDQSFERDEFLQLDSADLTTVISSNDLAVASELKVYQVVRRWVQSQPRKHSPVLGELLRHVRFSLFSPDEQDALQADLEQWGDLDLEWKVMDGEERLHQTCGLRQGMYIPHILCIDTQMSEYQQLETEEAQMSCYEPQAEVWEKLPGLQSLTHACCTSAGDRIYVSGGIYKNSYSATAFEFNAFSSQWLQLPAMAVPRAAHGFLFHRQKLYAMGGWRRFQSFLDLAESLDLATGMWTPMAKLPFALSHPASSVLREKLYLLGGATGVSKHWLFHRGILIFETRSNVWTQVPLANGFFAAGAVAMDNGIYVIGGYSKKKTREWEDGALVPENRYSSRKCFFINEAGKVSHSTSVPKLPRGLANAGVVGCGKRIYVLGGEDLAQRYKTIYHWEPGESRWHRGNGEIPVPREGISRFGCVTLLRPKPHVLQLFTVASLVLVAAIPKMAASLPSNDCSSA